MKPKMKKIIHLHDLGDQFSLGMAVESLCGAPNGHESLWVRNYAVRAARGLFTQDLCPRCIDLATMAQLAETAL